MGGLQYQVATKCRLTQNFEHPRIVMAMCFRGIFLSH